MEEIILMLTAGGASLGVALTGLAASIWILKDAYNDRDFGTAILGLILFFCAVIPAFGLFASLLFIGG